MTTDDQAWFESLSGKLDKGQGARLRTSIQAMEQVEASHEDTEHDWQRLKFFMRREEARRQADSRPNLRYFALAASVLILAGTVSLFRMLEQRSTLSLPEDAAVMRGRVERIILSVDPAADASRLELELHRAGARSVRHQRAEKVVLDVSLSYPIDSRIRDVLDSHSIPAPEQGDLTIVFLRDTGR